MRTADNFGDITVFYKNILVHSDSYRLGFFFSYVKLGHVQCLMGTIFILGK